MDVSVLKTKIQTNTLPQYLIFSGPEWKVQQLYINQIVKVTKKPKKCVDSIADVFSGIKSKSLVSNSFVYVVRDDADLMTNEVLQKQISSGVLGKNILIHLLSCVDKRTKFYKQYKDSFIEFEPLSDALLKKYIKKEIELSDNNCQLLINVCEHDYGRIL